jgi:hypothetical protein
MPAVRGCRRCARKIAPRHSLADLELELAQG